MKKIIICCFFSFSFFFFLKLLFISIVTGISNSRWRTHAVCYQIFVELIHWVRIHLLFRLWCHVIPVVSPLTPSSFSFVLFFASYCYIGCTLFFPPKLGFYFLLFCHCSLPSANIPLSASSCPKQQPSLSSQLSSFMFSLSIYSSIHQPPQTFSLSLSLPLISFPMLWVVSPVSVRTVITAVSSLGENKVVLCSQQHKRHQRNERKRA